MFTCYIFYSHTSKKKQKKKKTKKKLEKLTCKVLCYNNSLSEVNGIFHKDILPYV